MANKRDIIIRERMLWESDEKVFLKLLGEAIIKVKTEKKLTSKQIYELLEIDKSNYRRIEAGKSNVSILLLRRISKALNISLTELIKNIKD